MVLSPFAKPNFVDHTLTDQTSVMRFIEDNWMAGQRLGGGSFDAVAGSINGMFDWSKGNTPALMLDPKTGEVKS
jgi:phospholipase C